MAPPSSNEWKVMALYIEFDNFFAHYMFLPKSARRDFRAFRIHVEFSTYHILTDFPNLKQL